MLKPWLLSSDLCNYIPAVPPWWELAGFGGVSKSVVERVEERKINSKLLLFRIFSTLKLFFKAKKSCFDYPNFLQLFPLLSDFRHIFGLSAKNTYTLAKQVFLEVFIFAELV